MAEQGMMSSPATAPTKLDPRRASLVLLVLSGSALMVTYVETMVVPAIVRFQVFFGFPPISTVAWILSAYLLVGVVSTPIFGKLGDIYGKKRMLVVVMAVYAVAVSIAGFTPQLASAVGISRGDAIYLLIAVRGVQGLGMAMFPLAFAMVGEEFPPNRVATAQGVISAMFAGGAALGLAGGAALTQDFGWQFTYHTVIPVAFLMLLLTILLLRESRVRLRAPLDVPGAAFLGIALGGLLVALSEGGYWGWTNFSAVSAGGLPLGVPDFLTIAAVFALAFIVWEPRSRAPIVDFKRLRQRNIAISNVVAVVAGAAMFLIFVATSILVQIPFVGLGDSVLTFGLLALPSALTMMALAPVMGRWVGRFGPKPVMILGAALVAFGGTVEAVFSTDVLNVNLFGLSAGIPALLFTVIPGMVGVVTCFIAMTNVIVLTSRRDETGIQTGMNATFRTLGQSLGPVLATAILATSSATFFVSTKTPFGTISIPHTVPSLLAFQYVYLAAAVLGVVSVLISLGLINYRFSADGTRVDARASRATRIETLAPPSVDTPSATAEAGS